MNKGQLLGFLKQIQQLQNQEQISGAFTKLVVAIHEQQDEQQDQANINNYVSCLGVALSSNAEHLEALLHVAQFINDPNPLLINQLGVSDFRQNALPGNQLPSLAATTIANFLQQGVGSFHEILKRVIEGISSDPQHSINYIINGSQAQQQVADTFVTPPQTPRNLEEESRRVSDKMTAKKCGISEEQQALHQQLTLKPLLQEALRVFNNNNDKNNSRLGSSTDGRPGSSTDGDNNPGNSPGVSSTSSGASTSSRASTSSGASASSAGR